MKHLFRRSPKRGRNGDEQPRQLRCLPEEDNSLDTSIYTSGLSKVSFDPTVASSPAYKGKGRPLEIEPEIERRIQAYQTARKKELLLRTPEYRNRLSTPPTHPLTDSKSRSLSSHEYPSSTSMFRLSTSVPLSRSRTEETPVRSNASPPLVRRHTSRSHPNDIPVRRDTTHVLDDSTVDGSLDWSILNPSDRTLMERSNSPGALRLTNEGLVAHESRSSRLPDRQKRDTLQAWKLEHERRKWIRRRQQENQENNSSPPADDPELLVKQFSASSSGKSIGSKSQTSPKKVFQKIFGKNEVASDKAKELLEKERQAAEQQRILKIREQRERKRIEEKRRLYLEQERAKEAAAALHPMRRHSSPALPTVREEPPPRPPVPSVPLSALDSLNSAFASCIPSCIPLQPTISTVSSTVSSGSGFPPCVICGIAPRTHIATPCMHFSFCEKCASGLAQAAPVMCPVCDQPNITFSPVAV